MSVSATIFWNMGTELIYLFYFNSLVPCTVLEYTIIDECEWKK